MEPNTPEYLKNLDGLLSELAKTGCVLVPFGDFHRLLPGRDLHPAEQEFKDAMFSVTGQMYLEHGTSQQDRVMRFLTENRISLQMLKKHYLMYRGNVLVESFINSEL